MCCLVGVYAMVDHSVCTQCSDLVEIAICRKNISDKVIIYNRFCNLLDQILHNQSVALSL